MLPASQNNEPPIDLGRLRFVTPDEIYELEMFAAKEAGLWVSIPPTPDAPDVPSQFGLIGRLLMELAYHRQVAAINQVQLKRLRLRDRIIGLILLAIWIWMGIIWLYKSYA